jgi:hypothetical protein
MSRQIFEPSISRIHVQAVTFRLSCLVLRFWITNNPIITFNICRQALTLSWRELYPFLVFTVCLSGKFLLALASTAILGSEYHGTHDHVLLFHDSGVSQPRSEVTGELNIMWSMLWECVNWLATNFICWTPHVYLELYLLAEINLITRCWYLRRCITQYT